MLMSVYASMDLLVAYEISHEYLTEGKIYRGVHGSALQTLWRGAGFIVSEHLPSSTAWRRMTSKHVWIASCIPVMFHLL